LNTLKSFKDPDQTGAHWSKSLSEGEKESIQRGVAGHESGDILTSDQFWNK